MVTVWRGAGHGNYLVWGRQGKRFLKIAFTTAAAKGEFYKDASEVTNLCFGSQWEACFVKQRPEGDSEAGRRAGDRGQGLGVIWGARLSSSSNSTWH